MTGEFTTTWSEARADIWDELAAVDGSPNDLYCELLRAAATRLKRPEDAVALGSWQAHFEEALGAAELSRAAFFRLNASDFVGERAICGFFEDVYESLDDSFGAELAVPYARLLCSFIRKFNLRYELLEPCKIMPTMPGVFLGLVDELRKLASTNVHLEGLLIEFENSVRDLKIDSSEGRIKICIQKQMNLLEGIAQKSPKVTKGDLAGMCGELKSWPHLGVKTSVASLYSFASDYPGIRHAGNPEKALRNIELRDFVSMSILLTGCLPYLTESIDPEAVLWRN